MRRLTSVLVPLLAWATVGCGGAAFDAAKSAAAPPPTPPSDAFVRAEQAPSGAADADTAMPMGAPQAPPTTVSSSGVATGDPSEEITRDPSLIVYSASLVLAVHQVEQSLAAVERIAKESGGFLAKKQDREIVVRVPRAKFQAVVSGIDKVGDVLHRDISAVDVTEEHVDLEIRIKNARATQARLKELLAKANVKEAIEIEKELHRVTGELEALEGKLKVLRDRIAYSTITVSFQERAPVQTARSPMLPFPWLRDLGLPSLLSLSEDK